MVTNRIYFADNLSILETLPETLTENNQFKSRILRENKNISRN